MPMIGPASNASAVRYGVPRPFEPGGFIVVTTNATRLPGGTSLGDPAMSSARSETSGHVAAVIEVMVTLDDITTDEPTEHKLGAAEIALDDLMDRLGERWCQDAVFSVRWEDVHE